MKSILLVLIAVMGVSTITFAQGDKSLKAASKSLSAFTSDFSNTAALEDAKMKIEEAFQDDKVSSSAKSWNTRGDILRSIADAQIKQKLINPAYVITDVTSAVGAAESYMKAHSMAEKKGDKKNAVKGLVAIEDVLANAGVEQYNSEDYTGAFESFITEISVYDALKSVGEASRLEEGTNLTDKYFFAGLTGYYAERYEETIGLLKKADETGTKDAGVFQFIYEAYNQLGNEEEALTYLTQGREKYPDDSGLLFSEINYYLGKGELEKMTSKLETALEREPDNVSVMQTLGQVYDQLHVKMIEAGDTDKAQMFFDKSYDNYSKALNTDGENFDVNYSIGALYYNKAATFSDPLNEAANDLSAAGTKKYDAIKDEMNGFFEKALPYFLKCDEIKSGDKNTLIALKEIYVRKDMFDKSNEYKDRLEAIPE